MARIMIISCKKIRDISCVACIKCFKAINEKQGEFAGHEDIDVVAMCDCGDCPGLVIPKSALVMDVARSMGREADVIHVGTCIVKATQTAACPINLEDLKAKLEAKFNKKVIIGTHPW